MTDRQSNPLLRDTDLPPFGDIEAKHAAPSIKNLIEHCERKLARLLEDHRPPTWATFFSPWQEARDRLARAWAPFELLHGVMDSKGIREAHHECLIMLTEFYTGVGHNEALFDAYREMADGAEFALLTPPQQRIITNALRDFRLSGVNLSPEKRALFAKNAQTLARLGSKFHENVLDATDAWHKNITDKTVLHGVPESALSLFQQNAEQRELEGWLLNLEMPCYLPIIQYAENRALRRELYEAFVTRASDQGPFAGRWDNREVMEQLVKTRLDQARLLGLSDYAELSLETKMAPSADRVIAFSRELGEKAKPMAEREMAELREFARAQLAIEDLEAWDIAFASEKMRQDRFAIDDELLRPFFPLPAVLTGLFGVAQRLFGVSIENDDSVDTWHPDVRYYHLKKTDGNAFAGFYLDPYARAHKQGGAWMGVCRSRRRDESRQHDPIAYLCCNFPPPVGEKPSLLTHSDVLTLFHEFGHGLHHMLTAIDEPDVGGLASVEWDAVELPSQIMENWGWERKVLDLFAAHVDTGEKLPDKTYQRMIAARHFQAGMLLVRQLEFGLFDMLLHRDYRGEELVPVSETLTEVRAEIAVIDYPAFNRFENGFSHIFGGGYSAGYYSYLWAEVLAADAYSAFKERGIFDTATGSLFRDEILAAGGSRPAMDSFVAFRGRKPEIEPLLESRGID